MRKCKLNDVPLRLLNECAFCHEKGLKPGVLALEFKEDIRTQNYFLRKVGELKVDKNGLCAECAALINRSR